MYAATTLVLDKSFPWLKILLISDMFHLFGLHFLYGLHIEGREGTKLGMVVYVSFGSIVVLSKAQTHKIVLGLKVSGYPFIWVIRASNANGSYIVG
jgi:hypothetical protein